MELQMSPNSDPMVKSLFKIFRMHFSKSLLSFKALSPSLFDFLMSLSITDQVDFKPVLQVTLGDGEMNKTSTVPTLRLKAPNPCVHDTW